MRQEIEQAVALLHTGDQADLERALTLLQNTVFSFSMKVCGQREDAEDTMQEVLLKSVPALPKFESPKALLVWLYKVAKNRCLMNRRKSKFAPAQELSLSDLMPDRNELEQLSTDDRITPEAFAIRSEESARLRAAIQKLPHNYRIVLILRDMEGLTDDEVAEITGIKAGTVRVRLHRARLFVRNELMKMWRRTGSRSVSRREVTNHRKTPRCKAMFAQLSDYLDEQLDDSICDELEQHIGGCEPCKVFLATLEATIEGCRKSPSELPSGTNSAVLRRKLIHDYRLAEAALKHQS